MRRSNFIHTFILCLLLSFQFTRINSTTVVWSPDRLANYSSGDNFNDPESYIKDPTTIKKIRGVISEFVKKTNLDLYVFLISHMDDAYLNKYKNEKNIEAFLNDLSFLFLKGNKEEAKKSIFILFAIKDRKIRIRTGEMSRDRLTGRVLSRLVNSIESLLKVEDYSSALTTLLDNIDYELRTPFFLKLFTLDTIVYFSIALFFIILFLNKRSTLLLGRKTELTLHRIKNLNEQRISNREFVDKYCVICMDEKFTPQQKKQEPQQPQNYPSWAKRPETGEFARLEAREGELPKEPGMAHTMDYPQQEPVQQEPPIKELRKEEVKQRVEEEKRELLEKDKKQLKKDYHLVIKLPDCGHTFHLKCLDTWLRFLDECPVCHFRMGSDENTKNLASNLIDIHSLYQPNLKDLKYDFKEGGLSWIRK
jgi:hypothetical protein